MASLKEITLFSIVAISRSLLLFDLVLEALTQERNIRKYHKKVQSTYVQIENPKEFISTLLLLIQSFKKFAYTSINCINIYYTGKN